MEQYEILEQIGKGAFGSALLVRHRHEKKMYVLKKIRLARQTDRTRRSAHQEMELISKVRNPFIVEYKDSWVEKGCFVCIIIGYCEGGDIWDFGVLYTIRMLKIVDAGDFGLAKMLTSDDLASSVVGTPSYMCPELLADIPYGSKSDIWSLGCCIYEMAAHKPAFKALSRARQKYAAEKSRAEANYKCLSFSKDRALNPSISGTEQVSQCSTQRAHGLSTCSEEKIYELSVGCVGNKYNPGTKFSTVERTPRLRAVTVSATAKRQTMAPSKTTYPGPDRDSLPASKGPSGRFSSPTRARATTNLYTNFCVLGSVDSPNVSVNAPRIDKMAEYPMAYSEDPFFPVRGPSSTSARFSSSSTRSTADCSITMVKCTIQEDKVTVPNIISDACPGPKATQCPSEHVKACVSIRSSAEVDQRRFDTSSYQQRAEALEGLLEFSARLLQQQRFDELGVLLKPFGPEKVSPRETAIWLTKSFKETVV
ncbi:Serine/threonine-protein kinase [Vigna angularis]|uniref:non-specific serine/threonine protein kinase n=1 Tax=Phaseolus angularis TaxID=3914 RepID=A0A8T0L762_PHAAN|nr:Serine/threonine-protein kinase [Vigna angularis]